MRFILNHRPSPAMAVACIALTVALGGTSYAAITLPKNSVGAKQLEKNAVTPVKVKANAITSPKVAANSLTGADVNEASLGAVPSATNAINATNATNAANATNATNANTLGGIPATGFLRSTNEGGGALAGANVSSTGTVTAYFNRFGGAPTLSHTPGTGDYLLTFPGLEGKLFNTQVIHLATLLSLAGEIRVSSAGGNPFVTTTDSAGADADRSFFYVVYGTNLAP
jgi:hypothetical protein